MSISIGMVIRAMLAPTRNGFVPLMPVKANRNGPNPNPAEMAAAYIPIICPRFCRGAIWLIHVSAETNIIASSAPSPNLRTNQARNPWYTAKNDISKAINNKPNISRFDVPKRISRRGVSGDTSISPKNWTLT